MDGQTPINIFTINNKRREEQEKKQQFNITGGSSTGPTVYPSSNTYTTKMEELDKQLEAEGLKIERLSDKEKLNYVNSLSSSEYERMLQYRDAGYSFGSAKALVDLERQKNQPNNVGGYRGVGFQLGEPVGGADSVWDRSNPIGKLSESIDNRVQDTLVPMMTVTSREDRENALTEKYNSMTAEDWAKLREQYNKDPNAKHFIDDTEQENLEYYRKQQNMDIWDKLRGADIKVKEDVNGQRTAEGSNIPSLTEAFANAPASAIANASAVVRGVTNPLDNINMLIQLFGTKEGRELLAYRYLDEEGRNDSIEKDPVGWILDLFDLGALGLNLSSKGIRGVSTTQRLLGATNGAKTTSKRADNLSKASNSMENVADMGLSKGYDKLLDKVLGSLSQGGKMKNLVGDYISMTQRPLATIWNGANPKDEKGQQQYQTGKWTYEGVSKIANKVWEGMKDRIQTSATGLTPEVRERIRQNPYIKEYRERIEAMINDEGAPMDNQKIMEMPIEEVGNELLRRLDEYESRLQEDGSEYQILDSITKPYNISDFMAKVYQVFEKNAIDVTEDGLSFRTTANPADMNPIVVAWNLIKAKEPFLNNMTIKEIREFRKQLRSLIKYHSDAPSTKFSKNILRQLIDGAYNGTVHKEIPELAKVDEIYSKEIDELTKFKDGLVYQQGEKKGQIKDNFYSIISTLNTQNRQKMKERIEKLFPELGARVEAIRMLPILTKAYQSSPQMMRALFQRAGFLGGLKQSGGIKEAIMGWLVGIVADELFAKPMGEKWRKQAIDELIKEVSPEALQKLQEIKSKIDAGVELTEQEKRDLQTAIQDIMIKEYEYLDEKHKKAIDEMLAREKANQPKLPGTMDTIGPDGTIKLSAGKQVNNPENYKPTPRNRDERMQQVQEEYGVDTETAEQMTNTIEDFLDDVGANIQGEISPREVNYERFSEKTLMELMEDDTIPQSEKAKIQKVLETKPGKEIVKSETELDQEFAYRINKLQEEEQRVGKVGKNKVDRSIAKKQQEDLEAKRDALKVEMRERYGGKEVNDQERAEDKYLELSGKGIDYINSYKKSKGFREEQAEKKVLEQLKEQRAKEPKFVRNMNDDTARSRQEFLDNAKPENGYKLEITDYNDRYVNEQTGDRGAIKFNNDGSIEVVTNNLEGFLESGIMNALPDEAIIKVSGEEGRATAGELRDYEYQTVGRANPNEKNVTAEEGLGIMSFKGDKTIGDLADEYGLKKKIVEKIFTYEGEEALGRAKGDLIELVEEIKEGTAPHEVFHPIFNMVNKKRRQEIIDLVRKHKGITEKEAKERLADSFSEYFRTGKFDTNPIPKGFVNKVKWFFNQVREFINGTWRSRKKIQKLFDDIMENRIMKGEMSDGQKYRWLVESDPVSRLRGDEFPKSEVLLSDQVYQYYQENYNGKVYRKDMGDVILDKNGVEDSIAHGIGRNKASAFVAVPEIIQKGMEIDYQPDYKGRGYDAHLISAPIEINGDRYVAIVVINEQKSHGTNNFYLHEVLLQKNLQSDEFWTRINTGSSPEGYMSILKRLRDANLNEDYEYQIQQKSLFDQEPKETKLEAYFKEKPYNIDIMYKTYDPDIVEWMNNIKKKFVGGEDITMNELYEVKNMIDEHARDKGTQIDVPDGPTAQLLLEKAESMAKNKIGTYETKQIEKIGGDAEEILGRINDVTGRWYNNFNDVNWNDVPEKKGEMIYDLGETYDPDIDKRYDKFMKKLTAIEGLEDYNKKNIQKSGLQNLKAKVQEMERIGIDNFGDIWEDDLLGIFVDGIKEGINKTAKKGEKAVQQLVALHNLKLEHFEDQVKGKAFGGKSPMPSIAVGDPNVPHEAFGDITLVFGRDTIDPKVDKANKLYGSDAWTPMFPTLKEVRKSGKKGVLALHEAFDSDLMQKEFTEIMSEFGIPEGKEGIIRSLAHDVNHYRLELQDLSGKELTDKIDHLANKIAKINFKGYNLFWYGPEPSNAIQYQWYEKNAVYNKIVDKIKEIYTEASNDTEMVIPAHYFNNTEAQGDRPLTPENILEAMKNQKPNRTVKVGEFKDMIQKEGHRLDSIDKIRNQNFARMYHNDWMGDISDLEKRYNNIVDTLEHEYASAPGESLDEKRIGEVFDNIIEGKRYPYKSIKINQDLKNQFIGDPEGLKNHLIDELKKRDPRELKEQPLKVAEEIGLSYTPTTELNLKYRIGSAIKTNKMIDRGIKQSEARHVIKKSYDPDIQKFKEKFKKNAEGWNSIPPDDILQRIIDVVEQGKKVPIRFAESKPERVVNLFDEVQYVIAPRWERQKVKEIVEGTPLEDKVHYYNYGEGSRASVIKNLQKKYGNIFFSMGGVVMPIAMLLLMMQGEDDQGEGQEA